VDNLNNCTTYLNNLNPQKINYQNRAVSPAVNDTVSLSSVKTEDNNKKKKNNLIAYIAGGAVLLAGIAILIAKAKKGKAGSNVVQNAEEAVSSNPSKGTQTDELTQLNKKLAGQKAESADIERRLAESRNNPGNGSVSKPESEYKETTSHVETPKAETVKPATIEEQADRAYTMYAHKLAIDLKLENKEELIREALPDLVALKRNDDALKAVLEHVIPQNKDFVVKTAVPAILRNSEALDLGKAMEEALKSVSPDTVDCFDRLAANAKRFEIKSQVDSINILKSLTKENKDFAIDELFPYLAENMDKYKIRQSGIMGQFLEVVTPQNKDFILNEALPTLLKNSEALDIDITDALRIAKHLNQNNLKNIQTIAENIEKLDLNDANGFLDIDKFTKQLDK